MPMPWSARRARPRAGVSPLSLQGLDEALDLAVPARRVGRSEDLTGAVALECRAKRPRAAISERVVAHHRLGRVQPQLPQVRDCPLEDPGRGLAAIVGVLFDVGVARVIVDDAVQVDVAELVVLLAFGLGVAPQNAVSWAAKARQPRHVDEKQ